MFLPGPDAASSSSSVPTGVILDYGGTAEPTGWLLCYGQAVSRSVYSDLFTILGTAYGAGDGSTTFNLPDCRGRILAGRDNMGNVAANRITSGGSGIDGTTRGSAGGTETHTLTTAQMPTHSHVEQITGSGGDPIGSAKFANGTGSSAYGIRGYTGNDASTTDVTTANAGSGNAHQNTQPTLIVNKIIKT